MLIYNLILMWKLASCLVIKQALDCLCDYNCDNCDEKNYNYSNNFYLLHYTYKINDTIFSTQKNQTTAKDFANK